MSEKETTEQVFKPHIQTMAAKVWLSLERSGLSHKQTMDAINQMFKDGVLVSEEN